MQNATHADLAGTTSACAENTSGHDLRSLTSGNYLRVRGEYKIAYRVGGFTKELPPRARRIPYCSAIGTY